MDVNANLEPIATLKFDEVYASKDLIVKRKTAYWYAGQVPGPNGENVSKMINVLSPEAREKIAH